MRIVTIRVLGVEVLCVETGRRDANSTPDGLGSTNDPPGRERCPAATHSGQSGANDSDGITDPGSITTTGTGFGFIPDDLPTEHRRGN